MFHSLASVGLAQAHLNKNVVLLSGINNYKSMTKMWSRIHFTQCEEISTVLVSDVKPPYQTMIAISTVL